MKTLKVEVNVRTEKGKSAVGEMNGMLANQKEKALEKQTAKIALKDGRQQ